VVIVFHVAVLLAFPPLLLGVIGKTKAWFAGRRGAPLLQPYFDVVKCLRKAAVYSRTTTWVFRAGAVVPLASALTAGLFLPLTSDRAPIAFTGDFVLFAYLLALGRFFTMAAALDTGSSFEGMGASREAAFSALTEPVLFLAFAALAVETGSLSLSGVVATLAIDSWTPHAAALALAELALFAVLLVEASRVPIDDPATHLELTMIHEVMVLDHGGPDFGLILYGSAVKLFVLATLIAGIAVASTPLAGPWAAAAALAGTVAIAAAIGAIESSMARLRLARVPQFIVAAGVLAGTALAILLTGSR